MANLDKIKSLLGTLAPSIATALGGPLAGMAVGTLSKALLGDPASGQTDPSKIENAVLSATDPETFAKIRAADQQFQLTLDQHGIDLEKIAADDRASARLREVAVKDKTPARLAYFLISFVCLYSILVTFVPTKVDAVMLGTILGYLISESKSATTYFFGSNTSSERKTELIAGQMPGGKA